MERINYPRVTEIISPFTAKDLEAINPDVLAKAASRGTLVHQLCGGYARGLWVPAIPPECAPYFDSFKEYCDNNIKSVIWTEKRLYDDKLIFSGQVDMLVTTIDGETVFIDLKTSASESKSWLLQVSAYARLLAENGIPVTRYLILKLKKTGCIAKVIEYSEDDLIRAWKLFQGALSLHHYFKAPKEPKEKADGD